jgi:hypothetical protein
LGGAYFYDGATNRSVTVTTAAITEALRTVYDQPRLVAELTGGGRARRQPAASRSSERGALPAA